MSNSSTYTINELAQRAQVSRRTVRYYVQRGLLEPPEGKGRGSHYTARHLQHLLYIRDQQLKGIALEEIDVNQAHLKPEYSTQDEKRKPTTERSQQSSPSSSSYPRPLESWVHLPLHPHVHINIKDGALTPQQIQHLSRLVHDFIHTHSGDNS